MSEINIALLGEFIEEAREHLDEMESLLLKLIESPGDTDLLNDVFRTAHNIKGGAQLTGLEKVSKLSHRFEDLLDLLRQGDKDSTVDMVELFIQTRDRIVQLINELEVSQEEISSVDDLVSQLTEYIEDDVKPSDVVEQDGLEQKIANLPEASVPSEPEAIPSPVGDLGSISYQEENDKELFAIFIEHMQDQVSHLLSEVAQLQHAANPAEQKEQIANCKELVSSLRSSANYMGYEALALYYDNCCMSLDQTHEGVNRGEVVSFEFIHQQIDELKRQFPQLNAIRGLIEETGSAGTSQEDSTHDITADVFSVFEEEASSKAEASEINIALIDDFIDEAGEYLVEMESLLIQLVDNPGDTDLQNNIFRTVHNIKGGSQLTGLAKISKLSLAMEDCLDLLRQGKLEVSKVTVVTLMACRDRIVQLVADLEEAQHESSEIDDLVTRLETLMEDRQEGSTIQPDAVNADSLEEQAELESELGDVQYKEEHDQELFSIFIDHLRDTLAYLDSEVEQFKLAANQAEQVEQLASCGLAVSRLRSSANYMGYEELTDFYDKWNSVLEQINEVIARGELVSLGFMDHYFAELARVFPQIAEVRSANAPIPESSDVATPPQKEILPATSQQQSGGELYNKLNSALNTAMENVPGEEQNTLQKVFDEMVSSPIDKAPRSEIEKPASKQPEATAPSPTPAPTSVTATVDKKSEKKTANKRPDDKKIKKSVRVDADKIDMLMNQVGELVVDRSYFFTLFNEMRELQSFLKETKDIDQKEVKMFRAFTYRLSEAISGLSRTSNELQESVMKMRMLPISHIFNRFPRLVHDLSRALDKKVNLVVHGEETELDKMIVEELSDPLIHIIRNAIDHGIEGKDERQQNKKPEAGTLVLEAYQESNHIVVEISDDGRGIDLNRVKAKAIEKGHVTEDELESMSEREAMQLIMAPGFSTAEKVTGTSGRGVGMDVVRKNIEKLNGTLEIDSKPGVSTQMRLKIPLTLAIIHALMIRVGKELFTIPLANVDETVRIDRSDTSVVEGVEVIQLRGDALPVFHLSDLFSVKSSSDADKAFVVIVSIEGKRTGFVVDELMGQEEVVIKPLADYVQDKSGFSGATIIGDGRISLILDIYEMVKMTENRQIKRQQKRTSVLQSNKEDYLTTYDSNLWNGGPPTIQ